jgi:hypothetical protein
MSKAQIEDAGLPCGRRRVAAAEVARSHKSLI